MKIDELIRSKRKTLCLHVSSDGRLIVRAPQRLSVREIEKFIAEKRQWIVKRQQEAKDRAPKTAAKQYIEGALFPYLGDRYELCLVDGPCRLLRLEDKFLLKRSYMQKAQLVFVSWYKKQAWEILPPLVEARAQTHDLKYKKIRISGAKQTMGSCSVDGDLSFSWRLLFMPSAVIEYVVIHELAHLVHHNHSKCFWNKVESMLPNYKELRAWLRRNHAQWIVI